MARSSDMPGGYRDAAAVTPHDTNLLSQVDGRYPAALYISDSGTDDEVKVVTVLGTTVTFKSLVLGSIIPIAVKQVLATGTTADEIVALYD